MTSKTEETVRTDQSVSNLVDRLKETVASTADHQSDYIESKNDYDCMLGDLLVELRIITAELFESSLNSSYSLSIPVGRVLIMSGWIDERQLQMVIQLQSLLKDKLISMQAAHSVVELMEDESVTLEEALKCIGCGNYAPDRTNKLGELLVLAGVAHPHEVEESITRAKTLGLPFGRCLLLSGSINPSLLELAINAQRLVRQRKISKEEAVEALESARERLEVAPDRIGPVYQQPPVKSIRLGELLMLAGIISEVQLQYAVEMGLLHNLPLGQVLHDVGLISSKTLENALLLQKMVSNGSLKPLESVYALIDTHYYGFSVAKAISSTTSGVDSPEDIHFTEFLVSSGVSSKKTIRESIEAALNSPQLVGKAMLLSGAIDEMSLQSSLRCYFYIREGMLSFEEGVIVFDHSIRMGLTVEETIDQLGLVLRQRTEDLHSAERVA